MSVYLLRGCLLRGCLFGCLRSWSARDFFVATLFSYGPG